VETFDGRKRPEGELGLNDGSEPAADLAATCSIRPKGQKTDLLCSSERAVLRSCKPTFRRPPGTGTPTLRLKAEK